MSGDSIIIHEDVYEYVLNKSDINPKINDTLKEKTWKENALDCIALSYCDKNKLSSDGYCDFLRVTMSKVGNIEKCILIFIALLFVDNVRDDINEGITELKVLDILFKDNKQMPMLGSMIRLTLNIRKFYIPWLVCGATAAILISEDLSGKAVILNFLAASYFLRADNTLASLVLCDRHRDFIQESIFADNKMYQERAQNAYWESLIVGITATVMVVISITHTYELAQVFRSNVHCSSIFTSIQTAFQHYGPLCHIFFSSLNFTFDVRKLKWRGFFYFTLDLMRNAFAFYVAKVAALVSMRIIYIMKSRVRRECVKVTVLLVIFLISYIGVHHYFQRRKPVIKAIVIFVTLGIFLVSFLDKVLDKKEEWLQEWNRAYNLTS